MKKLSIERKKKRTRCVSTREFSLNCFKERLWLKIGKHTKERISTNTHTHTQETNIAKGKSGR